MLLPCSVLAILQTCRLAYDEAVSIFYSENLLRFGMGNVTWFLDETCSDRLRSVRRVALLGSGVAAYVLVLDAMQRRLPALQVLHVRRRSPSYADHTSWKRAAEQIMDQLAGFPALRELHLKSMEVSGISTPDKARKRQMLKVDRMLMEFVANKHRGKEAESREGESKDVTSIV